MIVTSVADPDHLIRFAIQTILIRFADPDHFDTVSVHTFHFNAAPGPDPIV